MKAGIELLIEAEVGAGFGDLENPLLVSVRSGARDSMPGMMDTILNLGLNDQTVAALARKTSNERLAWDCYRRFIQMYGDVVMGVQKRPDEDHEPFETVIEGLKHYDRHGSHEIEDNQLTADDLRSSSRRFQALVRERAGQDFPADPWKQLNGAVGAVFGSWMNDRAIVYRRASTTFPRSGALRSTCRRWFTATPATSQAPAWLSRATRRPARRSSMANS